MCVQNILDQQMLIPFSRFFRYNSVLHCYSGDISRKELTFVDLKYFVSKFHQILIYPCGGKSVFRSGKIGVFTPVVWGIRIQPTFALVRVVRGD